MDRRIGVHWEWYSRNVRGEVVGRSLVGVSDKTLNVPIKF